MLEGLQIRRKGILAEESRAVRLASSICLITLVLAMVAAQRSFFLVGGIHVVLLLVPIALASLTLGTWQGCAIGVLAGAAESLHSLYLPFDYYDKYFASPLSSIALFALFGLMMGVLFALACRLPHRGVALDGGAPSKGVARVLAITGSSFVGALFATVFLQLAIHVINEMYSIELVAEFYVCVFGVKESLGQFFVDAIAIALTAVVADYAHVRLTSVGHKRSLRVTFQMWLGALTAIFFLLASGVAYASITLISLNNMDLALSDHIKTLSSELLDRDSVVNAVYERANLTEDEKQDFDGLLYGYFDCDLPGWLQDVVVIAKNDTIFASNDEALIGESFEEVVSSGLVDEFTQDVYDSEAPLEYYQGSNVEISYMRASKINCARSGELGVYRIMVLVPSSEVFLNRGFFMGLVAAIFVVLFIAVFILAMKLLDSVVVQSINKTNEVLRRITDGDLAQRVSDSPSIEFSSLSYGINSTVNALEESIAEANARIDRELATARAIQKSALPSNQPPFPDIDALDLFATMDPAREVGGDFYDFFELGMGRIGFVVADVSGKGIPAALFMMAAKTEIRGSMEVRPTLAEAISAANNNLCVGNDTAMFVTVFAAIFDYRTGMLTYVNAGHNKPLVMRNGVWEWLNEGSGPFMGVYENIKYKQFQTLLKPMDEVFVYTDGVNEAFSPDETMYGNDRLEAFLSTHGHLHPRRLLRAMRADLIGWANGAEQSDDITMLAIKFGIPPEHGSSLATEADLKNFTRVENFLMHRILDAGCPQKVARQILVAVEELVVNVCRYAYPDAPADSPGPLRVHFTWRTNPNAIVVEIGDDGVPFNPLEQDDPNRPRSIEEATVGGYGLFMTRELMDEVEYVREGFANVTIITKYWD